MKRILISLLTIGLVGGAATGATVAYFTNTQTLSAEVTTSGDLSLEAVVTHSNGTGSPTLFGTNLRPGTSAVRCLWIGNPSTVPARFRLHNSGPDSGNTSVGDLTNLTFVLNPSSGACSTTALPSGFSYSTKYVASDFSESNWVNFPLRSGNFSSPAATPIRFLNTYNPLQPGEYLVFRVTSTLDPSATSALANQTYTTTLTLFGIQAEGSSADNNW